MVAQEVRHGRLGDGRHVCTFQMEVVTVSGKMTWVRINIYDATLVRYVDKKIRQPSRVSVKGELMNRKTTGRNQLTEVRAFEITKLE
jgi:single-stranded DNA-binding protein